MKSGWSNWLISLAIGAGAPVASFKSPPGYVINGHIDGRASGKIYLSYQLNEVTFKDSTELKDGNFRFKGAVPEPLFGFLTIPDTTYRSIAFFIENSNINIKADIARLDNAEIKGSKTQLDMQAFDSVEKDIQRQTSAYTTKMDSVYKSSNKAGESVDSFARAERNKLATYDFEARKAFVVQHPGSVFSAYMIDSWFVRRDYRLDKAAELFVLLQNEARRSSYGRDAEKKLKNQARSAIGAVPEVTLKDPRDLPVKLSSFRGKYVLVDFWASWCVPCRKQNPNLVANYAKYHAKGFEIVGISVDDNKRAWLKAINDDGLTWPQFSDLNGLESTSAVYFGIKVVPSNFLLDRQGRVIAKNLMDEELTGKLKSILSDN